jgi:hypothetical protein
MKKVLFILKKRGLPYQQAASSTPYGSFSSGLYNSVKFINDMLLDHHVESSMVEVNDNNDIDREVTKARPDIVVVEALWVVPSKFEVLTKLHPNVTWVVRIHSEMPFISNEGIAMDWLFGYAKYEKVVIAPNTERMCTDIANMLSSKYGHHYLEDKIVYLPNYYVMESPNQKLNSDDSVINVGCFGAIRPLKNQLLQALAAIEFAKKAKKRLRFHINASRVEQGNNVLKNIRNLFANLDPFHFELVEHGWLNHDDFLRVIAQMDISLQLSFSETFNICTADAISQNVPVVVSPEIFWVTKLFQTSPTSIKQIVEKMSKALTCKHFGTYYNKKTLKKYNSRSKVIWLDYLNG